MTGLTILGVLAIVCIIVLVYQNMNDDEALDERGRSKKRKRG